MLVGPSWLWFLEAGREIGGVSGSSDGFLDLLQLFPGSDENFHVVKAYLL